MGWTRRRTARKATDLSRPKPTKTSADNCQSVVSLSVRALALPGKGQKRVTSEYGKPDAVKVACPVWNGGKAERPYLSLQGRQGARRDDREPCATCPSDLRKL